MVNGYTHDYSFVSLFAGCGGADLGFHGGFDFLGTNYRRLPFKTIWANDINPFAYAVYRSNLGEQILCADLKRIRFENLHIDDNVDVLFGGFPCQEFSLRGPRRGLRVPRGQLYKHMRRAIRFFRPKIFVAENVPGIEHPPSILKTITHGLAGRVTPRYKVTCHRVNMADYGVPQLRNRILIVGIRHDMLDNLIPPHPLYSSPDDSSVDLPKWVTARDALEDLWDPAGPDGHSVADQDKLTRATIILGPKTRRDRRLKPDVPAPTIRAEHHGHIEVHYNEEPDGALRRLTVRECARIQGFPDTFLFPVSATQAYKQIGNAVPPVVIHHWAESISKWLRESEEP